MTLLMIPLNTFPQENRAKADRKRKSRNHDEDDSMDANSGKLGQFSHNDNEGGFVKNNDPYFYVRKSGDFVGNGHAHVSGQQRPVTVRSVKRRDKAKTEEKNNR